MHILKYIISSFFLFVLIDGFSQKQPPPKQQEISKEKTQEKKDTITYKTGYGLRVGIDISKPFRGVFDKSYNGLELVGDYRVSKNWYLATELGYEEEITFEDFTTSSVTGSYIKLGTNYNAYKNWLDMNNEIFVGMRYGFSIFNHTLNSYTTNITDANNPYYFDSETVDINSTENGLSAHWFEFQLGLKTETIKNLFLGLSVSYKIGLAIQDQTDFETLYAPGFNRVYASNTGFGFNYTISYLIPFVKK